MKIGQSTPSAPSRPGKQGADGLGGKKPATGSTGADLRPGQMLKGKVIGQGRDSALIVETESGVFSTKSLTLLDIGKEFWFEVLPDNRTGPQLVPASQQNSTLAVLRLLLSVMAGSGSQNPFAAALEPEQGAANAVNLGVQARNLLGTLADYGIGPESDPIKLLKFITSLNQGAKGDNAAPMSVAGIVAELSGQDYGHRVAQELESAIPVLSKVFDSHAQLNSLSQTVPQNQGLFLFPCFFYGASGWGEWLFSFDKQEKSGNSKAPTGYGISFYLAMSRLGDLHLQLQTKGSSLQGAFSLASQEAAQHVRESLGQLLPVLERMYNPVTISCQYRPVKILQKLKEDLSNKVGLEKESFALVDLTA